MAAITKGAFLKHRPARPNAARPIAARPIAARCLLGAAASLAVPYALAADWHFTPSIRLGETYTDNVTLAPRGRETSDFVTEIAPSLTVKKNGGRLKVNATYSPQFLAYARSRDGFSTNNQLNAAATGELMEDLFFLDSRANISQQNISAFGPVTNNNINQTGNRTEVRTFSLSPYIKKRFGSTADGEFRYTRDWLSSSNQGLTADNQDQFALSLKSGQAFHTLGWGLNYRQQNQHYTDGRDVKLRTVLSNWQYHLTPRFALSANLGYEKNNYVSIGENPQGKIWLAGFTWTPSERTSLDIRAGRRFFGNTYSVAASQRTRLSVFSLGYSEDLVTQQSTLSGPVSTDTSAFLNQLWKSSIPDDQTRQQVVDTFIRNNSLPQSLTQNVNSLSNRVFLQKSLNASMALRGSRNTALFTVFNTERLAQTGAETDVGLLGGLAGLDDSTRQTGAGVVLTTQLSTRTRINSSLSRSHNRSLTSARSDNITSASIALSRQLDSKSVGTVELRRQDQRSNVDNSTRQENALAATIVMNF